MAWPLFCASSSISTLVVSVLAVPLPIRRSLNCILLMLFVLGSADQDSDDGPTIGMLLLSAVVGPWLDNALFE